MPRGDEDVEGAVVAGVRRRGGWAQAHGPFNTAVGGTDFRSVFVTEVDCLSLEVDNG